MKTHDCSGKRLGVNSLASVKEREEAKRRILEENPDMPKDALEFVLSLPFEKILNQKLYLQEQSSKKKWKKSCLRK